MHSKSTHGTKSRSFAIASIITIASSGCGDAETQKPITVPMYPPPEADDPDVIRDEYIIALFDSSTEEAMDQAGKQVEALGGTLLHTFWPTLKAFSASIPLEAIDTLRRNPRLQYIEANRIVRAAGVQTCAPSWGIDRIDQRNLPLNGAYTYRSIGQTNNNNQPIDVYILDSGVDPDHAEFKHADTTGISTPNGSRVVDGVCTVVSERNGLIECDILADSDNPLTSEPDEQKLNRFSVEEWWNDRCIVPDGSRSSGHGTHLAGIVGGITVGVAKSVRLHAVRVLRCNGIGPGNNGSGGASDTGNTGGGGEVGTGCVDPPLGTQADLLQGINWTITTHKRISHNENSPGIVLIGASISVPQSHDPSSRGGLRSLADAMDKAINAGLLLITSAGNNRSEAKDFGPGGDVTLDGTPSLNRSINVGALDQNDRIYYYSNHGEYIDIFAPGEDITSAVPDTPCQSNGYKRWSGTSQAAAHVAGVAALLWADNPLQTADEIAFKVLNSATTLPDGHLGLGSPNRALFIETDLTGDPQDDSVDVTCADRFEPCPVANCNLCKNPQNRGLLTNHDGEPQLICDNDNATYGTICNDGECDICGSRNARCCLGSLANSGRCAQGLDCVDEHCKCGDLDQPCCNGEVCEISYGCDTTIGRCTKCGGDGEPCCAGDTCKGHDLDCIGHRCRHCGSLADPPQPCCDGSCLDDGLLCNSSSQCVKCGGYNDPCCAGDTCNGPNLDCINQRCQRCGSLADPPQPCCDGSCLDDGLLCNSNSQCVKCGGIGDACCAGNTCNGHDLDCINQRCQRCGNLADPPQPCCDGSCLNDGLLCNSSSQCVKCGGIGDACCAGDTCLTDGMYCNNSKCNGLQCEALCISNDPVRPSTTSMPDRDSCIQWGREQCNSEALRVTYAGQTVYCWHNRQGCYTRCADHPWVFRDEVRIPEWGDCIPAAQAHCGDEDMDAVWCTISP